MAKYSLDEVLTKDSPKHTYSLSEVSGKSPGEEVTSRVGNLINGAVLGIKSPFIGAGNLIGKVSDEDVKAFKQSLHDNAQLPGGLGGQVVGGSIPAAATSFMPGGNTLTGAAAYNALYGAIQPAESGTERLVNAGAGAVGGVGGQLVGQGIKAATSGFLTAAEQKAAADAARNAPRDAIIKDAFENGYSIPRSMYDPSFLSNRLESLAGKAATKQQAASNNQEITNSLARKALGLGDDVPLQKGTLEQMRKTLSSPYQEVAGLSPQAAIDLEALKQARNDANAWFNAYNRSQSPNDLKTAKQFRADAEQLEKNLESYAKAAGRDDLIPDLVKARKEIAKTWTVQRALNDATGDVSAPKIGRMYEKGLPLSDGLETIGKFRTAFPQITQEGAKVPVAGVSKSEALTSGLMGLIGAGATGNIAGASAALLPFLSHPARSVALSKFMQSNPEYASSLIPRIPGMVANRLPSSGAATGIGLLNYSGNQ